MSFFKRIEIQRFIILCILLLLVGIFSFLTHRFSDNRMVIRLENGQVTANDRLDDLLFQVIPELHSKDGLPSDIILLSFFVFTVILSIFHPKYGKFDKTRMIRRFLLIEIVVLSFRCLTLLFTSVPSSMEGCILRKHEGWDLIKNLFSFSCTDMMFSGHTGTAVVLAWIWLQDGPKKIYKILSVVLMVACIFIYLLNRLHYTMDIMVGLIISSLTCTVYSFILLFIREEGKHFKYHQLTVDRVCKISHIEPEELQDLVDIPRLNIIPLKIVKWVEECESDYSLP